MIRPRPSHPSSRPFRRSALRPRLEPLEDRCLFNAAPVLDPIVAQSVNEESLLTFRATAIDPDGYPGLVSLWRGNGSPGDSVDGNHGKLVNGATFAPGTVGQA